MGIVILNKGNSCFEQLAKAGKKNVQLYVIRHIICFDKESQTMAERIAQSIEIDFNYYNSEEMLFFVYEYVGNAVREGETVNG